MYKIIASSNLGLSFFDSSQDIDLSMCIKLLLEVVAERRVLFVINIIMYVVLFVVIMYDRTSKWRSQSWQYSYIVYSTKCILYFINISEH